MTDQPCKHGVQPALCVWCLIDNLHAEIDDLRAALAEREKDTKRLDWLESGMLDASGNMLWAFPVQDHNDKTWWIYGDDDREVTAPTLREAIDTAIEKESA